MSIVAQNNTKEVALLDRISRFFKTPYRETTG